MNYVKSFDLFGVPAKQIPATPGSGAPTTATEGAIGCLYMDTDTGNLYKCTAVADGVYTWVEAGNGGGLSETASLALVTLLKNAVFTSGDMYPHLTTLATELGIELPSDPVPATAIVLNSSKLSFTSDKSQTLTATLSPINATDTVAWTSSDITVATVVNGVVTPIASGNCTITATAGSVSAKCSVSVAIEAAPLYTLPDVTRSFSSGTDFLETTSENHIKITTVGSYAVGVSNCDTYADGYGKNIGCNPSTTWFTIPAGSTCELYALNGTGSGDITAYDGNVIKFIKPNGNWDGTVIHSDFYLGGNDIIAGTHKKITLDADTDVAAIASTTYSVGTIEFDLRLYVDGVRYI